VKVAKRVIREGEEWWKTLEGGRELSGRHLVSKTKLVFNKLKKKMKIKRYGVGGKANTGILF